MTSTTYENKFGVKDLNFATGNTGAAETFPRKTSTGGILTQNKIDATNLKYRTALPGGPFSVEDMLSRQFAPDGSPLVSSIDQAGNIFYGPVDISACANFAASVTLISTTQGLLVLSPGNHVGGGVTIPSTLSLQVLKGALITVATGTTFTCNGSFNAGNYQVFSLSGTGVVAGSGVNFANVMWWGAKVDGTTNDTTAVQSAINAAGIGGTVFIPETGSDCLVTSIQFKYTNQYIDGRAKILTFDGTTSPIVTLGEAGSTVRGIKGNLYVKGTADPENTAIGAVPNIVGVLATGRLSGCQMTLEVEACQDNIKLLGTGGVGVANNTFLVPRSNKFSRYGIWLTADNTGGNGWCNANNFIGNYIFGALPVSHGNQWAIRIDYTGTTNVPNSNKFYNFDMEAVPNGIYCNGRYNIFENIRYEGSSNFNSFEFGANSYGNKLICSYNSAVDLQPYTGFSCTTTNLIRGTYNTVNGIVAVKEDLYDGKFAYVTSALGSRFISLRNAADGTPNTVSYMEAGVADAPTLANPPTALRVAGVRDYGQGNEYHGDVTSTVTAGLVCTSANKFMTMTALSLVDKYSTQEALLSMRSAATTREIIRVMKENTAGGYDRTFAALPTGKFAIDNTISTAGSATISKPCGRVRIPSGSTSITITNTLVSATSFIFLTPNSSLGAAAKLWAVAGAGSFTVNVDADPTADVDVNFWVIN